MTCVKALLIFCRTRESHFFVKYLSSKSPYCPVTYRSSQSEFRARLLEVYDADEASKYDAWIASLTDKDHDACVADIERCIKFQDGMSVLDAGSGSGALCLALIRIAGIRITALEPCPEMLQLFRAKVELSHIQTVQGFCDHPADRSQFPPGSFDVVASRQLANGLFDPLSAFRNWHYWLRPGGVAIVMDGLFDRDAWAGKWDGVVDSLPLSACRTTATVPYLLEQVGFQIQSVSPMLSTNSLPSTRTPRYIVAATKPVDD